MTLDDGSRLFGKIYSSSHERADRWYRFGRTLLYGELEDDAGRLGAPPRRLRGLRAALLDRPRRARRPALRRGRADAEPRVPRRHRALFEDAEKLGARSVDDTVIDDGLRSSGRCGTSVSPTRDIKPANLLVAPRPAAARRRVQPADPSVALAPGRRPGEHDADACAGQLPDQVYARACRSSRRTRSPRRSPPPRGSRSRPSCKPSSTPTVGRCSSASATSPRGVSGSRSSAGAGGVSAARRDLGCRQRRRPSSSSTACARGDVMTATISHRTVPRRAAGNVPLRSAALLARASS